MTRTAAGITLAAFLCVSGMAEAAWHSSTHSKQHRSLAAKHAFKRAHPCPSTGKSYGACSGYTIDHVRPLACGGADAPANMQWQTNGAARAKDRWERKGC
jgi:hypothetical protein